MLEEYALKILPIRKLLVDVYSNLDAEYTIISFSKVDEIKDKFVDADAETPSILPISRLWNYLSTY